MKSSKYLYLLVFSILVLLQNAKALNYYWVNGSGNWDDLNHWATASGGTIHYTQIPTALDDVYFDGGSGFTVTSNTVSINQAMAFCRNMSWTGAANNPIIRGTVSNAVLYIFGSLTLIPTMNTNSLPLISFSSAVTGNTIFSAGRHIPNINFDGVGGGWILQDSLYCNGTIKLNNGSLNTNGQTLNLGGFSSLNTNTRSLSLGSSLIKVFTIWECDHTNLNFNAGTSNIKLSSTSSGSFSVKGFVPVTYYNVSENFSPSALSYFSSNIFQQQFYFHDVSLSGKIYIFGYNSFNNLTLTTGNTYQFISGSTQTIIDSLIVAGNCDSLISLQTETPGSKAMFSKSSESIVVDYVSLKDIGASGGASFSANHAVDQGNNPGWTFNIPTISARYWVGGSGNWGDRAHWSLTSGGAGGACVPSPYDDVFFDAASGFTVASHRVTFNQPTAFCRNMDWTGAANNPEGYQTNSAIVYIFGSLTLIPAMNTIYFPLLSFASRVPGNTIFSAGRHIPSINFDGIGGGWTLQDSLYCTGTLKLNNGSLNTNSQTLDLGNFSSLNTNTRSLTLGSSLIKVFATWECDHTNLNFNAGTSNIKLSSTGTGSFSVKGFVPVTYYNVSENFSPAALSYFSSNIFQQQFYFHDVSLSGKIYIFGYNSFNNLTLTTGNTYQFVSGSTQTIINNLNVIGNCDSLISLQTETTGLQATISKSSGAVVVDYVALRDIKASGGASFTANHAIDQGNNPGWTFNIPTVSARYWVGGSGNWGDRAHWSLTSGGAGGACVPSPYDDVFFDAASGFTVASHRVTFNQPTAFCRNMDWTGAANNPEGYQTNSAIVYIFGSLTLIPAMNTIYFPLLSFASRVPGNTIISAGRHVPNINFDGIGGGWILQDSLYCNGTLKLISGSFNTNNQTLDLGSFSSLNTNTRSLTLGSSLIKIFATWECDHTNLNFNAGTSNIKLSSTGTGTFSVKGFLPVTYYNVSENFSPSALSYFSSNISQQQFYFHDVSLNGRMYVFGNNSFNNLTLTAGSTYQILAGTTQIITNKLNAAGNCTSYILLESSIAGSPVTINKNGGIDSVYFVHVQDMHATGGVVFNAYNSVDLGGNAGWTFPALPPLGVPGPISGPTSVCVNDTLAIYQIAPVTGAVSYTWTVPANASIISGQGGTMIVVQFNPGFLSGNITVVANNGCTSTAQQSLTVTAGSAPAQPGNISGNNLVCEGSPQTYSITPVSGATSYSWVLPAGWSGSSSTNSINTVAGSTSGVIAVSAINGCSSIPQTLAVTVTKRPLQPGYINGDSVICNGATNVYSVYPVPGATSYTWTLPSGWIGSSTTNTITVTVGGGASAGYISVTADNSCGSSIPQTKYVFVGSLPVQPGSINGAAIVCQWTQQIYTVSPIPGAQSYTWTIPNSWVGYSNSNSITVFVGSTGGTVSVTANNSCGTSPAQNIAVTVDSIPGHPGAINGDTIVNVGDSRNYSITPVNGANGYNWFLNGGGIITTDPHLAGISIDWTTPGLYTLYVSAFNHCGNSDTSHLDITVNPGIQGIRVIPTISNGDFHIEFNTINNRQVSIDVIDMAGQVVLSRQQRILGSGNNVLLQLGHLPSGIYRLRVVVDGKTNLQSDKTVYYKMIVKSR